MQTQCPHCETRFRVTETQLNIADGLVRCGVCNEIFNAIEVSNNDFLEHDHQHSLLNDEYSTEHPTTPEEVEIEIAADAEASDFKDTQDTDGDNNVIGGTEPTGFNEMPATDKSRKDVFDFFDDDANELLPHVVPDDFRDSYSSQSQPVIATVLWSIGILLLTVTLLIEYVWFNRDQFNQIPELQVVIEKLCHQVECKNITMRNPSKIELVSRNIYSHPNEKDALIVNVTMKNNSYFAQPYPVMEIDFSDIRGDTVAARRFLPTEYLPHNDQQIDNKQLHLLQPNTNTSFSLEVQDPGAQAMTYEFNFL